jgi:hypothetical protein
MNIKLTNMNIKLINLGTKLINLNNKERDSGREEKNFVGGWKRKRERGRDGERYRQSREETKIEREEVRERSLESIRLFKLIYLIFK